MQTPLNRNLGRRVVVLAAASVWLTTASMAQTTYPDMVNVLKPSPEPALPAGFDSFLPPVAAISPSAGAPAIAEWTRIGQPDATLALTGSNFSSYTGTAVGKDTQFMVFGQGTGASVRGTASILRLDGLKAAVILPATLPTSSEYLIWPINLAGAGYPVAVNATDAWWIGPNAAARGDTVSVYGRNLASSSTSGTSHIYIQQSGAAGIWATVTAANLYKVDFTVPASLTDGTYQVWVHNGHGGHYGWSGSLTLTVNDGMTWSSQIFNVKNYGAKGDGVTDDEAAIQAALNAASGSSWSTVYLPAGTYMVSEGFLPSSKVRWLGDGSTRTIIRANAHFVIPPSYDGRYYCLFFNDGGATDITFQGLTIDCSGSMKGYLTTAIHLRGSSDVRFNDVTINAKGYQAGDFHIGNRISFENCSIISGDSGIFFGSATQVFVDRCQIYGTNDVNTMLTWWGGDGMSITNTTAQNYDDTRSDGWAQGRFVYGAGNWGSNRDIYVGDDTTVAFSVRPTYGNQNTGEQLLWEGNATVHSGTPVSATSTTVTFSSNAYTPVPNIYDAVIVNGTGLGQHRKIVGSVGTIITVSPAWNVPPDTSSTVIIATVVSNCAIYRNSLQGKSDYATRATASTGVEPFGNSYDFVVDGNTISQVPNGIHVWSMSATTLNPQSIECAYFNYYANNTIQDCVNGVLNLAVAWNGWPKASPYPGISYLGNSFVGNNIDSAQADGLILEADGAPPGDQLDLNTFERNVITNTPVGFYAYPDNRVDNIIAYKNNLSLGTALFPASVGLSLGTGESPALQKNTYTGFQNTYGRTKVLAPVLEAPSHVLSVQGTAGGAAASTSLALWNAGTAPMTWQATSDSEWLTIPNASGSLSDENGVSNLNLVCNPAALAQGTYSGTVTVTSGQLVRQYSVTFMLGKSIYNKRNVNRRFFNLKN